MPYILAGPFVALIGIMAVFFVLRRKSVEKRSMYSARRSQIEHKVRAARQRTLTPRGRAQKPSEETIPGATQAPPTQAQPMITYEVPAYEAPPAAPLAPPPFQRQQEAPTATPWDVPPAQAPSFDYPPAAQQPAYTPPQPEPLRPAPEPAPVPAPNEPVWTPAPRPAEPVAPAEHVAAAASATSAGGWSVVSTTKDTAEPQPDGKKKGKAAAAATGDWSLASGDAPGMEADEPDLKGAGGTVMALAQYAVLVVGLVMVLIGVLVMVANSHVT